MIHLDDNKLEISFPEIHENAGVVIDFQRTLRVPDDDTNHFLPPGLGRFPLRHIEDYDLKNNNHLKERGGVIMPMFQTDAVWLSFTPFDGPYILTYPIAIKIGTGKICAVSGDEWTSNLNRNPQDYVVTPEQEWIDGYNDIKSLNPHSIFCNLTVQALNLPNVETTLQELHNLDQDFEYNMHLLEYPNYLSINALKPQVIEEVKQNNKNKLIAQFIDTYNYDRGLNVKMQNFLQEMDARRGTDSKTVTPWCYV